MQHALKIKSLHDVEAECTCGGWYYIAIGEKSREEILAWHDKHLELYEKDLSNEGCTIDKEVVYNEDSAYRRHSFQK